MKLIAAQQAAEEIIKKSVRDLNIKKKLPIVFVLEILLFTVFSQLMQLTDRFHGAS